MEQVTTIGLDLAKSVFQVHGVDAGGAVVVIKKLRREKVLAFFKTLAPCLVGMEACGTAHYWAREIGALGHTVKLMPAKYVKAYVKRGKSDAADAAAICEAAPRPSMRPVPVKTVEQQSALMVHRARQLLVGQHTQLVNAIRGHMAELGIIAPVGRAGLAQLLCVIDDETDARLPSAARATLQALAALREALSQQIDNLGRAIHAAYRACAQSRRLETIPGIGPITASALTASVADANAFKSGRDLAAWIGLTPKNDSSGGKERLKGISKQGDRYLRQLLVGGAMAVIRHAQAHPDKHPWLVALLARMPVKKAAVAYANKMARIAWALLVNGGSYRAPAAAAST